MKIQQLTVRKTTTLPSPQTQQEEQQQFINKALDETKSNIRRTVDEATSQVPRYTQTVKDYQEQTIQAARKIADSYLDSQKEMTYQWSFNQRILRIFEEFWCV